MEIEVELTRDDYRSFQLFLMRRLGMMRLPPRWLIATLLGAVTFLAALLTALSGFGWMADLVRSPVGIVLAVLLIRLDDRRPAVEDREVRVEERVASANDRGHTHRRAQDIARRQFEPARPAFVVQHPRKRRVDDSVAGRYSS